MVSHHRGFFIAYKLITVSFSGECEESHDTWQRVKVCQLSRDSSLHFFIAAQ